MYFVYTSTIVTEATPIIKSHSILFLEPTSTEQWVFLSFAVVVWIDLLYVWGVIAKWCLIIQQLLEPFNFHPFYYFGLLSCSVLYQLLKQSRDCFLYTKMETNCVLFIVNIWLHYFYLTWKRS